MWKNVFVAMFLMAMVTIGTVSANPSEIDMDSCGDGTYAEGLLYGTTYTYENGYRVDVGEDGILNLMLGGIGIWVYPCGGIQYVGEELLYGVERGFPYDLIRVTIDENGTETMIPNSTIHQYATIDIAPCAVETCPAFVEVNSDTSELDGSYVYFTTLPNSRFVDMDGNGDWSSKTYLWTCDGTDWSYVRYSSSMGMPEGSVLEVRKTNLDPGVTEVLSAYAYLQFKQTTIFLLFINFLFLL